MCTHSATSQSCKGILKDAIPATLTVWSKLQNSNRRDWSKIGNPSDCRNSSVILHTAVYLHTPADRKIWGEREPPFAIRNLHQRPGLKTLPLCWHVASCPSRESKGPAASLRASCFSSTWTESHTNTAISTRFIPSLSITFYYILAFFSAHLKHLISQIYLIIFHPGWSRWSLLYFLRVSPMGLSWYSCRCRWLWQGVAHSGCQLLPDLSNVSQRPSCLKRICPDSIQHLSKSIRQLSHTEPNWLSWPSFYNILQTWLIWNNLWNYQLLYVAFSWASWSHRFWAAEGKSPCFFGLASTVCRIIESSPSTDVHSFHIGQRVKGSGGFGRLSAKPSSPQIFRKLKVS